MTDPGTRAAYDAVAALYADTFRNVLDELPLDRALITAFAEPVRGTGGPVADLGCGPGHVTAFLASLGLPASGIDLSPEMIARAREDHPAALLRNAGLTEAARLVREPTDLERFPAGHLLYRKPA
ncbi:methyltransferase domain-containing protein [Actinomadura sp. 3N407]|uniref:methyltransferase domain-containing protein n=1 Tax=Actinomadura sp. 3N407 TaxID=3457423 RepID=UPI003FCCF658